MLITRPDLGYTRPEAITSRLYGKRPSLRIHEDSCYTMIIVHIEHEPFNLSSAMAIAKNEFSPQSTFVGAMAIVKKTN